MARFVKLTTGAGFIWLNADRVVTVELSSSGRKTRIWVDDGSEAGDAYHVEGTPEEIAALLTDPAPRLHPSILVDDQPPAWAPSATKPRPLGKAPVFGRDI